MERTAVDIVPEKVEKLNNFISPIQDEYIEKYLDEAKKDKRNLDLTATTDGADSYPASAAYAWALKLAIWDNYYI